jgi:hypothetical protein
MKLYYFGKEECGTDFAIVPADSEDEAIEKLRETREKVLEELYISHPFYKLYKDENKPYFGLENCVPKEVKSGVYFGEHN